MTWWCLKCERFLGLQDVNILDGRGPYTCNICASVVENIRIDTDRLKFKQSTSTIVSILLLSSIFDALRDCTISYPISWWTWHLIKWISSFSVWIYLFLQIKNSNNKTTWIIRISAAISSCLLWEAAYKFGPEILK